METVAVFLYLAGLMMTALFIDERIGFQYCDRRKLVIGLVFWPICAVLSLLFGIVGGVVKHFWWSRSS